MIEGLSPLLLISQAALWAGFVVFLRIGAMMSLLPAFGEQSVPVRIRIGITFAFTLVVAPAIMNGLGEIPVRFFTVVSLLAAETMTGLFFGMMLRFFVFALQVAGAIAAQSTSLSQIFGGSAGSDPQPAIGHILAISGLAFAALLGLHVQMAAYMIHSYNLVPIGEMISPSVISNLGVQQASRAFSLGFTLAGPFMIASLIYNVTLGVINKAMPQLMVSFVGAPAITAGGLILLLISAPVLLAIWMNAFSTFMVNPFGGWP